MIQRIQTVYLILAVVLTFACVCLQIGTFDVAGHIVAREYNLMIVNNDAPEHQFDTLPMFTVLVVSTFLGIYSIFAYGNRIAQARFCTFNILLIVGWYILYAVYSRILLGNASWSFSPSVSAVFPFVALIFYLLARRGIIADEKLVRSADRIR